MPPAPEVPTAATVMVSIREPMSSLILSPAEMLAVEVTLMLVAPAAAGADSRAWAPGLSDRGDRGHLELDAVADGQLLADLEARRCW